MSERTRNPACALLTVLVLVLAGREVQRTFFTDTTDPSIPDTSDSSDELTIAELADVLDVDSWSLTLPEEITQQHGRVVLSWYNGSGSFLADRSEEELLGQTSFLVGQEYAGKKVRLCCRETEPGSYRVSLHGPGFVMAKSTFRDPLYKEGGGGSSKSSSIGWGDWLYSFNRGEEERWHLRVSFEDGRE